MKVNFETMFLNEVNSSSIVEIDHWEMIISLSEMAEAKALPRSPLWNSYFEKRNNEEKCKTCKKVLQCKAATLLALVGTERQVLLNKKEWAEYEDVMAVSTAANQCLRPRG